MFPRLKRTFVAAAVTAVLIAGCSGGSSSTLPNSGAGNSGGTAPSTHFRAASSDDKASRQRTLKVGDKLAGVDARGNPGYYTLVTSLTTDDNLNFAEWDTNGCSASIWDAPWYWSLGNFSIPVPANTSLYDCTVPIAPTPNPSATTIPLAVRRASSSNQPAAGTYIVQVDIGLFSLSVTPLAGPETEANSYWSFPAYASSAHFSFLHLYAFYVATWTPSTSSGGGGGTSPT